MSDTELDEQLGFDLAFHFGFDRTLGFFVDVSGDEDMTIEVKALLKKTAPGDVGQYTGTLSYFASDIRDFTDILSGKIVSQSGTTVTLEGAGTDNKAVSVGNNFLADSSLTEFLVNLSKPDSVYKMSLTSVQYDVTNVSGSSAELSIDIADVPWAAEILSDVPGLAFDLVFTGVAGSLFTDFTVSGSVDSSKSTSGTVVLDISGLPIGTLDFSSADLVIALAQASFANYLGSIPAGYRLALRDTSGNLVSRTITGIDPSTRQITVDTAFTGTFAADASWYISPPESSFEATYKVDVLDPDEAAGFDSKASISELLNLTEFADLIDVRLSATTDINLEVTTQRFEGFLSAPQLRTDLSIFWQFIERELVLADGTGLEAQIQGLGPRAFGDSFGFNPFTLQQVQDSNQLQTVFVPMVVDHSGVAGDFSNGDIVRIEGARGTKADQPAPIRIKVNAVFNISDVGSTFGSDNLDDSITSTFTLDGSIGEDATLVGVPQFRESKYIADTGEIFILPKISGVAVDPVDGEVTLTIALKNVQNLADGVQLTLWDVWAPGNNGTYLIDGLASAGTGLYSFKLKNIDGEIVSVSLLGLDPRAGMGNFEGQFGSPYVDNANAPIVNQFNVEMNLNSVVGDFVAGVVGEFQELIDPLGWLLSPTDGFLFQEYPIFSFLNGRTFRVWRGDRGRSACRLDRCDQLQLARSGFRRPRPPGRTRGLDHPCRRQRQRAGRVRYLRLAQLVLRVLRRGVRHGSLFDRPVREGGHRPDHHFGPDQQLPAPRPHGRPGRRRDSGQHGPFAEQRINANTTDGAEAFTLSISGDFLVITGTVDGTDLTPGALSSGFERINKFSLIGVSRISAFGGAGNDSLTIAGDWSSYSGIELLFVGGAGADVVVGNGAAIAMRLLGEEGDDNLTGGLGNDIIEGGAGNDTLTGRGGLDWIDGGSGNDALAGNGGDDTLLGDFGNDTLRGGAGSNTYMFDQNWGTDTIVEAASEPGAVDTMDFSRARARINVTIESSGLTATDDFGLSAANTPNTVTQADNAIEKIVGGRLADRFFIGAMSQDGLEIDGRDGNDYYIVQMGPDLNGLLGCKLEYRPDGLGQGPRRHRRGGRALRRTAPQRDQPVGLLRDRRVGHCCNHHRGDAVADRTAGACCTDRRALRGHRRDGQGGERHRHRCYHALGRQRRPHLRQCPLRGARCDEFLADHSHRRDHRQRSDHRHRHHRGREHQLRRPGRRRGRALPGGQDAGNQRPDPYDRVLDHEHGHKPSPSGSRRTTPAPAAAPLPISRRRSPLSPAPVRRSRPTAPCS